MGLHSIIDRIVAFGTAAVPEKEARRMRAVTITALCAAATTSIFVLKDPTDIDPLTVAAIGTYLACILLHRLGPGVAGVALILAVFWHVARITTRVGTGDAIWVAFLTAAPLSILLFGTDRKFVAAGLSIIGVALAIILRLNLPYETGYVPPPAIKLNFAINFTMNAVIVFMVVFYVSRGAERAQAAVEREYARSEALLENILPPAVALRLKNEELIADRYDSASVLFADMAGFTALASDLDPARLVAFLNDAYSRIDRLVEDHGLEKIKTSGDSYMVVSGVPVPRADHADAISRLALDMRDALADLRDPHGNAVPIRLGIASGPVVAGVVGRKKFFYDVWGDTVNVAARMEQTGEPGRIQIAPETRNLVSHGFSLEPRSPVEVRGKGEISTWFLTGLASDVSSPAR